MNSLDKKWKEFVYAASGFGPNLLNVILGAYLTDALNPAGLTEGKELWSISGFCLVTPAIFGLQMFLAAQNTLISGVMKLGPGIAAILNTCAFAPVPFMLFIYYKMLRKKGVRFSYDLFCCCNT